MRLAKRVFLLFLVTAITFCCLGCDSLLALLDYQLALPENSVRFYSGEEQETALLSVEEVLSYESPYAHCNSTWFRDQLTGEDLCVYNAYLYAMEHCYNGFELYVADNEKDFYNIRWALSLDSPFLEQNINEGGETNLLWPANRIGERVHFKIAQFTQSTWDNKLLALKKCKEIVDSIPDNCKTQEQKAAYLFQYVCDHVEYTEYETLAGQEFLYDAVIKGKTNCDGYSNMLLLLFKLAGADACEAMGDNSTQDETAEEDDMGHTWVVAKLDGVFYNFDATYEDTASENGESEGLYFAYSDQLVDTKYFDCEDLRPKCTDTARDFDYADLAIDDLSTASIKKVAKFTDSRVSKGKKETLVLVKAAMSDDDLDDFLDNYIKKTRKISSVSASMVVFDSYTCLKLTVKPW